MYTKFEYNKDQKRRDEILGVKTSGGYTRYENCDVKTLKILIDEKFADPEEIQNESPCIGEFYDFMVEHPEFKAIGYVTGSKRDDYRVSVEGIEGTPKDIESMFDFAITFRLADEFDLDETYARCWYD